MFRKNRERLLHGDVARAFFERVVAQAEQRHLLSAEHFTVDGTLIEAWAGLKSFQRKDTPAPPPDDPGNPTVDFMASAAPTRRKPLRRTPRRTWRGRAAARKPSSPIRATS